MTAQVFSGEVDESVRHEQQLMEGEIMRLLKLLDMSINHQVCAHSARWLTADGQQLAHRSQELVCLQLMYGSDGFRPACTQGADVLLTSCVSSVQDLCLRNRAAVASARHVKSWFQASASKSKFRL